MSSPPESAGDSGIAPAPLPESTPPAEASSVEAFPSDAGPQARAELQRLRAELERLGEELRRLQAVVGQAGDVIVTADLAGRVIDWNEGAAALYGYTADEAIGMDVARLYRHAAARRAMMRELRDSPEGVVRRDVQVHTRDGAEVWVNLSLSWLRNAAGQPVGTIGVSKDVTERRRLEERLRRLSITDNLTGLYNQSHFFHRLEIEKERSIRLDHDLALLYFDLDGFKRLNDTRGHTAGDGLLQQVGRVLFDNVRKEVDSAFRYGGDEFTVLLPGADTALAARFAERVRRRVAGLDVGVRASMGIAPFGGDRVQQIVQQADQAMYLAKRAGGDRIAVFDPATGATRLIDPPALEDTGTFKR
ncbi:MAG: diguanylate cyclase [Planctomycetota bacterium]